MNIIAGVRTAVVVAALALGAGGSAVAGDGFLTNFAHRCVFAFSGYDGAAPLTNFPALVRLVEGKGNFSYAECLAPDGRDVRFSLGNGIELPSECVAWNPSGTSEFWVRIPVLTSRTRLHVHWGHADAPIRDPAATVWDATYTGVWSLDDAGSVVKDSSLLGNHGGAVSDSARAAGVAGACRQFTNTGKDNVQLGHGTSPAVFRSSDFTYECWFKLAAYPSTYMTLMSHCAATWNDGRALYVTSAGKLGTYREGNASVDAVPMNEWHHALWTKHGTTWRLYLDGVYQGAKTSSNPAGATDTLCFELGHCRGSNAQCANTAYLDGSLDEARVSNRGRSADYARAVWLNVASNDVFLAVAPAGGVLAVVSDADLPPGTVFSPALGTHDPASEIDAAAPASVEQNGVKWTCTGWTLHGDGDAAASGGGNAVSTNWPAGCADAVLTWRWRRQYAVALSAGDGGSVSPAGTAWYDAGTNLAVLATPADASSAFYAWGGNCPTLEVFSASFTLPVDGPRELAAQFATAWYVRPEQDGYSDGNDGLSPDQAKCTVEGTLAAIAAAAAYPAVVLVDDGTYALTNAAGTYAATLAERVAIRSLNGPGGAVFDFGNVNKRRGFYLNHYGAVLDGLVFIRAKADDWNYYGVAVNAAKGHVRNCLVRNSTVGSSNDSMINLDGGWMKGTLFTGISRSGTGTGGWPFTVALPTLVEGCVVSNNTSHCGGRTAGVVRNSLFADNAGTGSGGGLILNGSGSLAQNCTFANNSLSSAGSYGGGVYGDSGNRLCLNCAFAGNSVPTAANGMDFYNVRLLNGLSAYADPVNGCVVGTPTFTDAEAGDYRPTGISATLDRGGYTPEAFVPGAVDVDGHPRVRNGVPDIGSHEYFPTGDEAFAVTVNADQLTGTDSLTVHFTAVVAGAEDFSCYWDFGDGGTSVAANPSHTFAPGYYTVKLAVTNNVTQEGRSFEQEDMVKVMPSLCYVRAVGESSPQEPYAYPETAANTLREAVLVGPRRIDVGEGLISAGSDSVVSYTLMDIAGRGPDKTVISGQRITLQVAGSSIRGLCVSGAPAAWNASAVNLSSGTMITNCLVAGCPSYNQGGIRLTGGAAFDCTVRNGTIQDPAQHSNAGIYMEGSSVIERCMVIANTGYGFRLEAVSPIIRNSLAYGNTHGGVYSTGAGRIENCTLVCNTNGTSALRAGGIHLDGSGTEIVNTVLCGNVGKTNAVTWINEETAVTNAVTAEVNVSVAPGGTASFSHCCAPELAAIASGTVTVDAGVTADPKFNFGAKASLPYWGLLNGSPCLNAGVEAEWMEDATDLVGEPRIRNRVPDIGAYEGELPGGTVIFVR